LAPGLRLGWLLAPAGFAEALARAKLISDCGSPTLEQAALAEFLERGEMDRHVRRTRQIYRRRRDALVEALQQYVPGARIHGIAAGLHVLVELEGDIDEAALVRAAREHSIRMYASSACITRLKDGPVGLVLGYGAMSEDSIPLAVKELASVIAQLRGAARVGADELANEG
jgi:GntR family transcriptional regulator / MocR family aminotransferase